MLPPSVVRVPKAGAVPSELSRAFELILSMEPIDVMLETSNVCRTVLLWTNKHQVIVGTLRRLTAVMAELDLM